MYDLYSRILCYSPHCCGIAVAEIFERTCIAANIGKSVLLIRMDVKSRFLDMPCIAETSSMFLFTRQQKDVDSWCL